MGNCVAACKSPTIICSSCSTDASITKEAKVLKIVKPDGKVVTFRDPILVKDILVMLSGSGIGLSKEGTEKLPPNYELGLGKVYYLLPSLGDSEAKSSSMAAGKDDKEGGGIRRIKIIIPKQQLQELLAKKISMEDLLLNYKKSSNPVVFVDDTTTSSNWKPKLESVPEGSELVSLRS